MNQEANSAIPTNVIVHNSQLTMKENNRLKRFPRRTQCLDKELPLLIMARIQ